MNLRHGGWLTLPKLLFRKTVGTQRPSEQHAPLGWHELVEMTWSERLEDPQVVVERLVSSAEVAEMTVLGELCHEFAPYGISAVLLLAESHASIHTWPERGRATLDVFSCSSPTAAAIFVDSYVRESGVKVIKRDIYVRGAG